MRTTLGALVRTAAARLEAAGCETARLDAELLVAKAFDLPRTALFADALRPVDPAAVEPLLARREAHEPVAYILGTKAFRRLDLAVSPAVLVPRPETEHLVEAALALTPRLPRAPRLLDLGTGSGCIAVTLALELPGSRVAACDRSTAALAVARRNARRLGGRVAFVAADWARPLDVARFDLLVSNPPYLDPGSPVPRDVADWEPPGALWGGEAGLAEYRALLAGLARARPGTPLLVEIGAGQGAALGALARELGWRAVETRRDLAGIERVVTLVRAAHDDAPEPHATAH